MKKILLFLLLTALTFTGCYEDGLGPDEPNVAGIELSQSEVMVTGYSGEYDVVVTSSYEWSAYSEVDWILVETANGEAGDTTLKFKVSANPTSSSRTGAITVLSDSYNLSATLTVVQTDVNCILEIAGAPVVNNAISVDIPVVGKNILKLACLVKEIYVNENGDKQFVSGYNEDGTPKLSKYSLPTPAVVFRNGSMKEAGESFSNIHLDGNDGLNRNKKFEVFIAAAISNTEYYNNGEILSVEFETPDRYADEDVAVISQSFEGMDVYLTLPQHVKDSGRRIKWGVTNIAMLEYNGNPPIPQMLHSCDYVYPAYLVARDTLLNINHYNAYRRNAQGEIGYYVVGNGYCQEVSPNSQEVLDGAAGPIQYYYHFQPGEPLVLLLSEVYYADCDCDNPGTCGKTHPTIDWGWGKGWYHFPYDMEAYQNASYGDGLPSMGVGGSSSNVDANKFWNEGAWYKEVKLTLPGPKQFAGTVDVNVSNVSTNGGTIKFTPDSQTYMYLVGVFEEVNEYGQGYYDIVNSYFDGDENLWQWFTTSEMAPYFGVFPYYAAEGVMELKLEEYFATLQAGSKYHIVVNALPGKIGDDGDMTADVSSQNFQHISFKLKDYTLPEPELVVTAVEPYSPWKVKFNVKNPNWRTNPVDRVSFVANYTREFESFMKANEYTYTDMAMMNAGISGYQLTDADVDLVNSNGGADVEFDVYENSSFTAAFIAWNTEGRVSNPDSTTYPGYATARSLNVEPAEALDMTKLNALKGDWTATAIVKVYDPYTGSHVETERNWKVSIGDLNENQTLSAADYLVLENSGVSKSAADAYLAEYNQQAATYNASVRGQNRVLCQGWQVDNDRTLSTASPWDLFLMADYNASTVDYLFHDFGPKWFLQVNANGDIFIPVNYNRIPPLTCWYNGQNHYLCGGNYETMYAMLYDSSDMDSVESMGIPVQISEDGNTVVLQSYVINYYEVDENGKPKTDANGDIIYSPMSFYPNVLYESTSGLAFYNSYVVSNVVLTKGWAGTASVAPKKASMGNVVAGKRVVNVTDYKTPARPYASTVFTPQTKVQVKQMTAKQPTVEETRKGMEKLVKKLQPNSNK